MPVPIPDVTAEIGAWKRPPLGAILQGPRTRWEVVADLDRAGCYLLCDLKTGRESRMAPAKWRPIVAVQLALFP